MDGIEDRKALKSGNPHDDARSWLREFQRYAGRMPYAITLGLDPNASASVQRIWHRLAEQTGEDSILQSEYGPHITLAVAHEFADAAQSRMNDIGRMVECWECLPVTLVGIGIFPGSKPVIWAAPVVTEHMLALHRALHTLLDPSTVHPHYLPGAWMPHVTLCQPSAAGLADIMRAALLAWDGPISGEANRVDFVQFHPVNVLRSVSLSPRR